jgi:wyosine [tRNA(Phe)-imidazoG37] synthetase (radical SAM superfamily)
LSIAENLHFRFVSESWAKLFFVKGVNTKNSNIIELVNFSEKIQILHIHISMVTLKMTSCRTMSRNKMGKKMKIQHSMGKTNFFFGTLPFIHWVVLDMQLFLKK